MKRSRTCQCLVELDTPKRTRSTPDLGALQRRRAVFGSQQNFLDSSPAMIATSHAGLDAAMRLFQQPVSSSATATAKISSAQAHKQPAGEAFVVDSIVRSTGRLNEITILENEQFIGDESVDYGVGIGVGIEYDTNHSVRINDAETQSHQGMPGAAATIGSFGDSGDSSDFLCGVAIDDDVDEDVFSPAAVTAATEIDISRTFASQDNPYVPLISSDSDSARQVSDSSSSGSSSNPDGFKVAVGEHVAACAVATAGLDPSPMAVATSSWTKPRGYSYGGTASSPTTTAMLATDAWRQPSSCPPRVRVTVSSPRNNRSFGSTSSSGVRLMSAKFPLSQQEGVKLQHQQRYGKVSPAWPVVRARSDWRGETTVGISASCGEGDVDMVQGLNGLRLTDSMWKCWSVGGAGEDADVALEY